MQDVTENIGLFEKRAAERAPEELLRAFRHGRDNLADQKALAEAKRAEEAEIDSALRFRLGRDTREELSDDDRVAEVDDELDAMYEDYKEAARLREATQRAKKLRGLSRRKRLLVRQLLVLFCQSSVRLISRRIAAATRTRHDHC